LTKLKIYFFINNLQKINRSEKLQTVESDQSSYKL